MSVSELTRDEPKPLLNIRVNTAKTDNGFIQSDGDKTTGTDFNVGFFKRTVLMTFTCTAATAPVNNVLVDFERHGGYVHCNIDVFSLTTVAAAPVIGEIKSTTAIPDGFKPLMPLNEEFAYCGARVRDANAGSAANPGMVLVEQGGVDAYKILIYLNASGAGFGNNVNELMGLQSKCAFVYQCETALPV